ncbi:MAG: hypothetical protein GY847_28960 [Proteobacteria bacterium]|nr:hypothetical protein [Pseudomonadota bacterium]
MNPETHLKNWLLAVGDEFGIRHAYEYHNDDESTEPDRPYFEYRVISSLPIQEGVRDLSSADGFDLTWRKSQTWLTKVEVVLHNSPDGLACLAGACIAAQYNKQIIALFDNQAAFAGADTIDNQNSTVDGETYFMQRLVCGFHEGMEFELVETNGIINTMDVSSALTVSDGITDPTIMRCSPGDAVASGSASFLIDYVLAATAGDAVASGSATFETGSISLLADTGDIVASGAASFAVNRILDAIAGDAVASGSAEFAVNRLFAADTGDAVASGAATFITAHILDAETGDAVASGAAEFIAARILNADAGDAVASGAATFSLGQVIDADTGDIVASGSAEFAVNRLFNADTGDIVASGVASFILGQILSADTGLAVASGDASFITARLLEADTGLAVSSGTATLAVDRPIQAATGDAVSSGAATFAIDRAMLAATGDAVASGSATFVTAAFPANTVLCDSALTTGAEDGSSWEDAYRNLQDAIDACSGSNDKIWVKARTETLTVRIDTDQEVTVYGGFDTALTGTNGSILGRSASSRTTLDGDDTYAITAITEDSTYDGFVFQDGGPGSGGAAIVTADNAAFINCVFDGNTSSYRGGAIDAYNGDTLTFTDCTFSDNYASSIGGAVNCANGELTFVGCVFDDNSANNNGGAIYETGDVELILDDCTFINNVATGTGGAVRANGSGGVTMSDCTFGTSGNPNLAGDGPALYVTTGSATGTITDCDFSYNETNGGNQYGGAICIYAATHTWTRCNFYNNDSGHLGGAAALWGTTLVMNNCICDSNAADNYGGVLYMSSSADVTLNSCLLSNNEAGIYGGGVRVGSGTLETNNCTFADNTATSNGGGIYNGATTTVTNCCFYDNNTQIVGGTTTVEYSNIEGTHSGTGNIDVTPNFRGSGDPELYYQPTTTSDMITEGDNGSMTATDLNGDSWLDDTMGCLNLDDS